ncbi:MAG: site-2 protease family protein, partial [Sediminibacterium sp.]|nr:site-2 protease family protein [Sediminibacterium sp.]
MILLQTSLMVFFSKLGQFILCFSILVVLHELGHFIPAKLFKCKVEKFYLFFNPWFSIFKKKIGETEYGLGWIPFGGYVKIAGMIDESMDKDQLKKPIEDYEFRSKPAWQRLIIMLGGVIVNILLAIGIFIMIVYIWGTS